MAKISKTTVVIAVLVLAAAGALGYYCFNRDSETNDNDPAKTTSTTPTAQTDFQSGEERKPGNSINESQGSGGIEDTGGQAAKPSPSTKPITSYTGEITLYAPLRNEAVTSGASVSGSSKLESVSYRIIDDISGMIATGKLNVINGKFSGNMKFTTNANQGRLDIYGVKNDGTEFSNIEVPIRFK